MKGPCPSRLRREPRRFSHCATRLTHPKGQRFRKRGIRPPLFFARFQSGISRRLPQAMGVKSRPHFLRLQKRNERPPTITSEIV